jgi:hypothetical protein
VGFSLIGARFRAWVPGIAVLIAGTPRDQDCHLSI